VALLTVVSRPAFAAVRDLRRGRWALCARVYSCWYER